jgi:hypothetical protein
MCTPLLRRLGAITLLVVGATWLGGGSASAQTRLTLEAGGLEPLSDMADVNDASFVFAARMEFQEVNPLGKARLISFFTRFGYAPLAVDPDMKASLERQGESADSGYFTVSGGVRVYSRAVPLFLGAGIGYAHYDPPGDNNGRNGFESALGAGLSIKLLGFIVEGEARAHITLLDGARDIQFLTLTGGLGLPF